ncbi:MAG TPA: CocE/NonD family hydrolase [Dongiaceae bacterium]|nr:CocE/NonD family hydrolase [Dongiaceae bacterium]
MDGSGPRSIRLVENSYIRLSDGVRVAAKIWLPEDPERHPVPAILEMIPYRKRDGTIYHDHRMHPWIAGQGYACVRVDIRGSGESEGLLSDEYLAREQQDGVEIVEWLSRQPWCSGSVGMTGISWGGFNSLQVAALRPPALKAIITLCSTDDRYADDIHFMGGCLINEHPSWSADRFTWGALPPDPQLVGEKWREIWLARLEAHRPWLAQWLAHQRRDAYWTHGSVCENYGAITCAVYAIGGWDDSYSNAVPRLLAGLSCPRKGLIGPWTHAYPHLSAPGPAIGYLQEAVRWWDHWLKGLDTGMMAEPIYRVWMLEPKAPRPWFAEHPGRWVAEPCWPSPRIAPRAFHLTEAGLADAPPVTAHVFRHRSPQITGTDCGRWGGYGGESPDLPLDQRVEDGRSLCFDSAPLAEDVEILGAPEVELTLAADRPQAHLAARICDVAPDGTSALVTYAPLNLAHRDSHEHPAALEPGRFYRIKLKLNDIARRIPAGHHLRLALATAHWPIVWPTPDDATLSISTQGSRLILPQRPPRPEDADLPPFEPALAPPPIAYRETRPAKSWRRVTDDLGENLRRIEMGLDYGAGEILDISVEDDAVLAEIYEIRLDDPLSARARIEGKAGFASAGHRCRIETVTELSATRESFEMAAKIEAFEDGKPVFARCFRKSIPREFM